MFKKVKVFLYNNKITIPRTLNNKILYLITKRVNIYDLNIEKEIFLQEKNINDSIVFLNSILIQDINNSYIVQMTDNKTKYFTSIYRWGTNDNRYINNIEDIFITWLELTNKLNYYSLTGNKCKSICILYSNAIRFKSYLLNSETLIDLILDRIS